MSIAAHHSFYPRRGKRVLDVAMSALALLVLSPLLAVVALGIKLQDGGSVVFRQRRIGRRGRPFTLLKFRSMAENVGDVPSANASTLRVTRLGQLLRRTNIDELPQLVNILRGDMSIVGPRPALPAQQHLIQLRHGNGAFECAPGLTGLAQIRAYTGMPEAEKAGHDAEYAANITFAGDVSIIVRTFGYVLRPPPVY